MTSYTSIGITQGLYGGFPKLGVPSWGGPHNKDYSILGLYWGPLILGNYHIGIMKKKMDTTTPAISQALAEMPVLV